MKVGDKLICKCNTHIFNNTIQKNTICIISRVFNDNKILVGGIIFDTKESILYYNYIDKNNAIYVYDYFYTPDEIRLKKLESL